MFLSPRYLETGSSVSSSRIEQDSEHAAVQTLSDM